MAHPRAKILALMLAPTLALASVQDPATITAAAESHARAHLAAAPAATGVSHELRAAQLDPRLRLAPCSTDLDTFTPAGGQIRGNAVIGVRCLDTPGWSIYVPVTVETWAEVLVLVRALPRGAVPGPDDVATQRQEVSRLARGWIGSLDNVAGRRLARPAMAGAVLTPSLLETPPVIKRGEKVTIQARAGGIHVRSAGVAMSDAGLGDRLSVRNDRSQRVVEGRVVAPGVVEI